MSDPSDLSYKRFNREHRGLYFASRGAFALLLATILFEFYLSSHSPTNADLSTNQVVQLKVRGGHIFVRPTEYYLNRGGYLVGAGTLVFCLLALARESIRQPGAK